MTHHSNIIAASRSAGMTRRRFIRNMTGLAVSAGPFTSLAPLLAAPASSWPVGCRDLHLKVAGKPDSWSCMKALGAQCIEVDVALDQSCPNLFHPERKYSLASAESVQRLKEDLAANGCKISAFMMANHFDERLEQEVECARSIVKAAQSLGVNAVRIDVVPRKLEVNKFLPFAIQACKRMCETAEGTPVRFGVENHGKIANDPAFLQKLFEGVGSSHLGLTLDCANFYWWGHPLNDLYSIYKQVAPRVIHTHCKSIRYPEDRKNVRREMGWEYGKYNCPVYEGDIDFKRVVQILRDAAYKGDLCVEDESLGKFPESQRSEVLAKEIAFLKKLE